MEGSRASARRLRQAAYQASTSQTAPRNRGQSLPSPHANRGSSAENHSRPIAGSLRGPLFLLASAVPVLHAARAATLTRPASYLRPPASSLQQETRQDHRRSAVLPLTSSSTTAPPRRHHPSSAPPPSCPNARTWSAVAHSHREVSAPVSAPASACTRPDPAVITVSHLHWG